MAKRKFVYSEKPDGEDGEGGSESDSMSDDVDIIEDDLERDLSNLDKEQAEFIRKINRMGALSFTSGQNPNTRGTF